MLIALQDTHHGLPFWRNPTQPKEMFDPTKHGRLTFKRYTDEVHRCDGTPLCNWPWAWNVLIGISLIEMPQVMAHVSAFNCYAGDGTWGDPKRFWVQFTTIPTKVTTEGIPLVVEDGRVQVEHLWGGDNRTYSPFDLIPEENRDGTAKSAEFWMDFFKERLRSKKEAARVNAFKMREDAEYTLQLYEAIT